MHLGRLRRVYGRGLIASMQGHRGGVVVVAVNVQLGRRRHDVVGVGVQSREVNVGLAGKEMLREVLSSP